MALWHRGPRRAPGQRGADPPLRRRGAAQEHLGASPRSKGPGDDRVAARCGVPGRRCLLRLSAAPDLEASLPTCPAMGCETPRGQVSRATAPGAGRPGAVPASPPGSSGAAPPVTLRTSGRGVRCRSPAFRYPPSRPLPPGGAAAAFDASNTNSARYRRALLQQVQAVQGIATQSYKRIACTRAPSTSVVAGARSPGAGPAADYSPPNFLISSNSASVSGRGTSSPATFALCT